MKNAASEHNEDCLFIMSYYDKAEVFYEHSVAIADHDWEGVKNDDVSRGAWPTFEQWFAMLGWNTFYVRP